MLYSCTRMAPVGVKGLILLSSVFRINKSTHDIFNFQLFSCYSKTCSKPAW